MTQLDDMTPLGDQIRDLYRQVTNAEQPPAKVSIAEALRRGRLLRRWRRFSAAAAPVVAAAVVAGIALAATPPTHAHRLAPAKPPIPNPVPQPGLLDPLTVNMSFGWLPPGEAAVSGSTGDINSSLNVGPVTNPSRSHSLYANTRWRLREWALGFCTISNVHGAVHCPGLVGNVADAAPDINGHRAFWLSGYWPHQALVWTYAPGLWAQLTSTVGVRQSDQTVLRIARGVVIGAAATQPVKFAVQLTGVPLPWRIGSTSVRRVGGNWLVQDEEVTIGKRLLWADAAGTYNGLPQVTTYVGGGNCNQFGYMDLATTRIINGYDVQAVTVRQRGMSPMSALCAPHAHGLLVYETLQSRPRGPRISLTTLFLHMKVLGPKPSDWTLFPIG